MRRHDWANIAHYPKGPLFPQAKDEVVGTYRWRWFAEAVNRQTPLHLSYKAWKAGTTFRTERANGRRKGEITILPDEETASA